MKIISCNSNAPLSSSIATFLKCEITDTTITKFNDGEIFVEIHENVRGEDAFVIQSTSNPANDNLMELLIMIDALRRSSAKRITAVIPYFGYARQDRKSAPRTPISAKLVANLLTTAGADRVLSMDLHAGQIQGFFDIPTDNLLSRPIFLDDIITNYDPTNTTIISPDVGGVVRARDIAERIHADLGFIDKRRPRAGVSEVMNVVGNIKGRDCIIVDDIVDSAGTLCNAANHLIDMGAASVTAYITHGVFSGAAQEKILTSKLREVVITDTIKLDTTCSKLRIITSAELFAKAINNIHLEQSISELFK